VLTEAGLDCGHESYWTPLPHKRAHLGDSSWCAVPDLGDYPGSIFHQTRHPLAVVASLLKHPDHTVYLDVRERLLGPPLEDRLLDAIRLWVLWNAACEWFTAERWRVEDVDGDTVSRVAQWVGKKPDPSAIDVVPRNWNFHGPGSSLSWDDLPAGKHADKLRGMAERYGYA
jgi:hypothetical protein